MEVPTIPDPWHYPQFDDDTWGKHSFHRQRNRGSRYRHFAEHGSHPVFHPNRNRLGGVNMHVSLFIGDTGGIDMDRVTVLWMTNGNVSIIPQSQGSLLICPNWTITGKYNLLPGHEANADNILNPHEQFDLFICPEEGAAPYQQFTVAITPPGAALPLPVHITAPGSIQPIMVLN